MIITLAGRVGLLKDSDGQFLWDSEILPCVHWALHVQHQMNSVVDEFFSSEDISFIAGVRPRGKFHLLERVASWTRFKCHRFSGKNDGVGGVYAQKRKSIIASFELEHDIERGPSTASTCPKLSFGAPSVASTDNNDDNDDVDNNDGPARKVPQEAVCEGEVSVLDAVNSTEIRAKGPSAAASHQQLFNDDADV